MAKAKEARIELYYHKKSGKIAVISDIMPKMARDFSGRFLKDEGWKHTTFLISKVLAPSLKRYLSRITMTRLLDFLEFMNQIGEQSIMMYKKEKG